LPYIHKHTPQNKNLKTIKLYKRKNNGNLGQATNFFFWQRAGKPSVLPPFSTLTYKTYAVFGAIRDLFVFVQVGARFPRRHLVGMFSDSLLIENHLKKSEMMNVE